MLVYQHLKDWMLWRVVDLIFIAAYILMLIPYGLKQLFNRKDFQ